MRFHVVKDFAQWRCLARGLIGRAVEPSEIRITDSRDQVSLFDHQPPDVFEANARIATSEPSFHVSPRFLEIARTVGFHRDANRWNLLYTVLWRLMNQRHLLEISTDEDVQRLNHMEKQVRRDAHKMKAFVRFRKISRDGRDHFIAWHRPDHFIVRKVAPFFARRFKAMNWTILTPDESVSWDQHRLTWGDGVPRRDAPANDELEDLWRTYYAATFNPARVKIEMMKREMPVRHWPTLPEADVIDELLDQAPRRVEKMIAEYEGYESTATDIINAGPETPQSLDQLAQLASNCKACDLHLDATQTVFGAGPIEARLVLVGEQPGDQEDLAGIPFVGPAGSVLEKALSEAGIDRESVYVTNIVKHFKHRPVLSRTGKKKRLHAKPNAREIRCCRPWFDAEWQLLENAEMIVCLGATAANVVFGAGFKLTERRGQIVRSNYSALSMATWHPSAILRATQKIGAIRMSELVADLKAAAKRVYS